MQNFFSLITVTPARLTTNHTGFICLWESACFSHLWQRRIWTGTVFPHSFCSEPHTHNDPHPAAVWRAQWSPVPSCWMTPGRRGGRRDCLRRGARSCSPTPAACPGCPAGPAGQCGTTAAVRTCNCLHCTTWTLAPAPGDSPMAGWPHWIPQEWLWSYRER